MCTSGEDRRRRSDRTGAEDVGHGSLGLATRCAPVGLPDGGGLRRHPARPASDGRTSKRCFTAMRVGRSGSLGSPRRHGPVASDGTSPETRPDRPQPSQGRHPAQARTTQAVVASQTGAGRAHQTGVRRLTLRSPTPSSSWRSRACEGGSCSAHGGRMWTWTSRRPRRLGNALTAGLVSGWCATDQAVRLARRAADPLSRRRPQAPATAMRRHLPCPGRRRLLRLPKPSRARCAHRPDSFSDRLAVARGDSR